MAAVCFDISSGGISAAIFDANFEIVRRVEGRWEFATDKSGAATLSANMILERFKIVLRDLKVPASAETIAIGCFMHNTNECDPMLTGLVGVKSEYLSAVARRGDVVGRVNREAATEFRLPEGMSVITGSGDGFFASVGSDCDSPSRVAVTLGTSGVA